VVLGDQHLRERLLANGVNKSADKDKLPGLENTGKYDDSKEEWQQRQQLSPALTIILFIVAMVILAFSTFYTKIMVVHENQNPYESFYAINALNLLFFGMVIKLNINGEVKQLIRELKSEKKAIPMELTQISGPEPANGAAQGT